MEDFDVQENRMKLPGSPSFPADTDIRKFKNVSHLTEEEKRQLETECKLAQSKDEMSQLVDRIASNNFQG
jgi:hypothetical protein